MTAQSPTEVWRAVPPAVTEGPPRGAVEGPQRPLCPHSFDLGVASSSSSFYSLDCAAIGCVSPPS
eukprot:3805680-Pyramimonas_sp.AAC.1